MTERSALAQTVQIGLETVAGTAVPAAKKLQSIGISPSVKANVDMFRPAGTKYQTVQALGKEWVEADVEGQPTYDEFTYLLSSILKKVSPSSLTGAARRWDITPSSVAEDTVATYSIEQGSPKTRAHKFSYGLFNEMGLSFDRDKIELKGKLLGQRLTDGIQLSTNEVQTVAITGAPAGGNFTLTYAGQTTANIAFNAIASAVQAALEALSTIGTGNVVVTGGPGPSAAWLVEFRGDLAQTDVALMTKNAAGLTGGTSPDVTVTESTKGVAPSAIPLVPVLPSQLSVYVDTTSGGLGGTKLLRVLKGELSLSDRFGPLWVVDAAQTSWVTHVETEPKFELKLTVEADANGMAHLTALRDGSTRFIRLEAVGAIIAGSDTYLLRCDMAGKISDWGDFSDEDGVYAVEFTFTGVHDASWGQAMSWRVQNTLTAL